MGPKGSSLFQRFILHTKPDLISGRRSFFSMRFFDYQVPGINSQTADKSSCCLVMFCLIVFFLLLLIVCFRCDVMLLGLVLMGSFVSRDVDDSCAYLDASLFLGVTLHNL